VPVPSGPAPKGPAALCPVREPGGRINYPPVLRRLLDGPGVGTPNRAIVCRYAGPAGLAGAADVTDPQTVSYLDRTLNGPSVSWNGETCPGRFEMTYVFLTDGRGAVMQTVDITDCFAWTMPQSRLLPAGFAAKLFTLTS
jgi:hypothetical protein